MNKCDSCRHSLPVTDEIRDCEYHCTGVNEVVDDGASVVDCDDFEDLFPAGSACVFDSHGADSTWSSRDGETCTVLRPLTDEEADLFETGPMYQVRFSDGTETSTFIDELTLASEKEGDEQQ